MYGIAVVQCLLDKSAVHYIYDHVLKKIFDMFSGRWGRRGAYWIVHCSQWHGRINVLWNDFGQNACFQNDHIGCVFHEFCWNDCLHVYYELWSYCSSLLHCLSLRVSFEFIIQFLFENLITPWSGKIETVCSLWNWICLSLQPVYCACLRDHPFKTSACLRGRGVKNLPNLPTDSTSTR